MRVKYTSLIFQNSKTLVITTTRAMNNKKTHKPCIKHQASNPNTSTSTSTTLMCQTQERTSQALPAHNTHVRLPINDAYEQERVGNISWL
jgi:hypothetical protein